jgi:hydroxyacylglutathione hydrolase
MNRLRGIVPGVLVATAEYATTISTVVAAPDGGCLLIDPAVTAADLAGLADDLASAGLRPRAGFATHPHWDHVLWSSDLGDVPRYASADAVTAVKRERAGMISELEQEQAGLGHDLSLFGRLTALPESAQEIPWDGPTAQLIVHDGHAPGHAAVFFPDTGVLVAGDMLSDIEMPILDTDMPDPLGSYRTGLQRLAAVGGVRWVIPGHGHVGDAAEYHRRVAADLRYLDLLEVGQPFQDPRTGTAKWLAEWHDKQLRYISGAGSTA